MATPRWVESLNQPIAIRDVIDYLMGCLEDEETVGETLDIGGKTGWYYLNFLWQLKADFLPIKMVVINMFRMMLTG
ncbi:hypothetical protein D1BOALGB6SA_946 [Olavius sp. associated proteobacterium Delta 1]|nr:hypothetical protein D1BOALGB6SA_946 [Olavius sp. associated proteobacterium Delta 1]